MIDVVIPIYKDLQGLKAVLAGFPLHTDSSLAYRLHVVCDGGDREACEKIAVEGNATFSYLGPEKGLNEPGRMAAARNLGLKLCEAERVLFIDGDCVPSAETIATHTCAEGILVGRRLDLSMEKADLVRAGKHLDATEATEDIRLIWKGVPGELAYLFLQGLTKPLGEIAEAIAWTCHVSYPTKTIRALGGFWEQFIGWSFEDNEMAWRAIKSGQKLRTTMVPVYHLTHPKQPVAAKNEKLFLESKAMDTFVRNGGPI